MPEPKEYITKIMQIPDRLIIFLLYLTWLNCNDGPGAMAPLAPPAPAAPVALAAPAAPMAPATTPATATPLAPPGMTVLGVANLQVIYFCLCQ